MEQLKGLEEMQEAAIQKLDIVWTKMQEFYTTRHTVRP